MIKRLLAVGLVASMLLGSNGISYAAELRVSEIAFDAESFSVYGVVYTVDFTYDGFTYCIEGGSSICLSELAQILGRYETDLDKAFSIGNVSNVSFTDYDLVKIEKQADEDWLLTSLAPFTSEETLTIEMNNGVTFIVDVTDAAGDEWTISGTKATAAFTNTRKTGDEAPLGVLFGGLGLGAAGLAVLLWYRRKKNKGEE